MQIDRRLKKLEKGQIKPMEYVVRIIKEPHTNDNYPEREEDIRENRHVVLIVKG